MILLQTVPSDIDVDKLKNEVLNTVKAEYNAIIKIHDLHIWTLSGNQFVGTVHIKLMNCDLQNFNEVRSKSVIQSNFFKIFARN